ncbi:guanylate cyclase activator 2B [Xyrauchen texanus]|uniref:guanylate cyclase activator 2B n=1 Tax=Xyrauchen texanus TaxID=154827 RepID=UPI002241C403|nr:guanylate cyclase activator 2B [Xyrauchen texanus]
MRVLTIFILLATCLFHGSQCVQVTDSGYSFSLEAVKTLKKLLESDMSRNTHQTYSDSTSLCADPELPGELTVMCDKEDADTIFKNLVKIITPADPCEICANAACTGCV